MTNSTIDVPVDWLTPIALRGDLVRQGYHDRAIGRLVRDGTLARLRWGAYCDGETYRSQDVRGRHALISRAVVAQARADVSLSHSSALPWFGAPDYGLDLSVVNVTRHDARAGRREAGVRQHCGILHPDDVVKRGGVSLTSPTRSVLEFTTMADVEAGLVQVNHLLHTGQTTPEELSAMCSRFASWPNSLRTDLVCRLADGRIESVVESRFFHLCFCYSLPMPEPQFIVGDRWGRQVARLDFAWPALKRWVEVDGLVKYEKPFRPGDRASDVVLKEKRREELVRSITGWSCKRIDNDDLSWGRHTAERVREFLLDS